MFPIVHNHKHMLASAEVPGEARNALSSIFQVQLHHVPPILLLVSTMVPGEETSLHQRDDLANRKNENTITSTSIIMPVYIMPSLTYKGIKCLPLPSLMCMIHTHSHTCIQAVELIKGKSEHYLDTAYILQYIYIEMAKIQTTAYQGRLSPH